MSDIKSETQTEEYKGTGEFLQKIHRCQQELMTGFFLSQVWVFLFFLTGIVQVFAIGLYFYTLILTTIRFIKKWHC